MDEALQYTCSEDIDQKERELLAKILDNYNIHYTRIEKIRSAYKIIEGDQRYCLKMLSRGYKRAHKSYFLSTALKERNFECVAPYVYTKHNDYLVRYKKSSFYITEWIDGSEVSFKDLNDILDSARFLAEFHQAAKGLAIPDSVKIRNKHNQWNETFEEHIDQVKRFEAKIDKKSKSTGFDLIFKNNMNIFMAEASFAVKLLHTKEAENAFKMAEIEGYMCHDSFYYQNILRDNNGKLVIIDLESSQLDCPMSDLGKFIRRIICKTNFKWDFDLCRRIIDAYNSVRPISRDELYPLLAMLAFPHKYWKFGKKRYIKKKDWTEEDYQKKLKKILSLQRYKNEFVRSFMMFYDIRIE